MLDFAVPLCWGMFTGSSKFAMCLGGWLWEPLVLVVDVWASWDITGAITNFGLEICVVVKAPVITWYTV